MLVQLVTGVWRQSYPKIKCKFAGCRSIVPVHLQISAVVRAHLTCIHINCKCLAYNTVLTHVCMYVCLYGWKDKCMYVCMDGWYACMHECIDVCMYECMSVFMSACMFFGGIYISMDQVCIHCIHVSMHVCLNECL